jgi:hypothetical protein
MFCRIGSQNYRVLDQRTSFGCQELICAPPRSNAFLFIYSPRQRTILLSHPCGTGSARCLARCCVSCAMTKPVGQSRQLRIARVAHKSCASREGLEGSMVCPIYTYSSAERASCPTPKKARPKLRTEIGPWYLDEFGNPTREVKRRY